MVGFQKKIGNKTNQMNLGNSNKKMSLAFWRTQCLILTKKSLEYYKEYRNKEFLEHANFFGNKSKSFGDKLKNL